MLHFDGEWRFDSPGPIPDGVWRAFDELINRIIAQGNRKQLLEHFKSHFASAAGVPHNVSSSEDWAVSDLGELMRQASANAPMFIEAFYNACDSLAKRHPEMSVPSVDRINRILRDNDAGYQIELPNLVATRGHTKITVHERPKSLDERAQEVIQSSLQESERLLSEGKTRQAVQEILWLLETVVTGFRGLSTDTGTVEGSYFNKIIGDLRAKNRGTSFEQALQWMMTLHGYLSAPKGGGIRHGMDLKAGLALEVNEARLYCNLIRSYINFLIIEHERLAGE